MKTITILVSVLWTGAAFASGDMKVPTVPKTAPVAAQVTAYDACMQRIATQCKGTHRTRLFTKACVFRNRYQCR